MFAVPRSCELCRMLGVDGQNATVWQYPVHVEYAMVHHN